MKLGMLATGGTIASRHDERGALVPVLRGRELLESAGVIVEADVDIVDMEPIASYAATLPTLIDVVLRTREMLTSGCSGVVVTHGTDTLEEMAFLMALLLPKDAVVALTGAQRPVSSGPSDAHRNLADAFAAVRAALPVCVVMGGHAIAGFEARKVHTSATEAFSGGAAGSIAVIDDGEVVRLSTSVRGGGFAHLRQPRAARVDIVKLGAGVTPDHIPASVSAGARGIVLEAMGRGNAGEGIAAAVREACRAGVTVVVTSRVQHGIVRPAYGAGGGADLREAGAIFAGDLNTSRARIALALALAHPELGTASDQLLDTWKATR